MVSQDLLREIEEYLKRDDSNSKLIHQGNIFIGSLQALEDEMEPIRTKIESINDKLKAFDFLDFVHGREMKMDMKKVSRILRDLEEIKGDVQGNEEYERKWQDVHEEVVEVGKEMPWDFNVEGEVGEEMMEIVIESRRRVCRRKILHYTGPKAIFYKMLVNQEMFMWGKLFPEDLRRILSRLVDVNAPFGCSKFERFIYAILCEYLSKEDVEVGEIGKSEDRRDNRELVEDYFKMKSEAIDFFYNSLLYKSKKLRDGVIDL